MAEWTHLSEPHPEWAPVNDQIVALFSSQSLDPIERRRGADEMVKGLLKAKADQLPQSGLTVEERPVPVEGGTIPVRIYTKTPRSSPVQEKDRYPALVLFHGGGYVLGGLDFCEEVARTACVRMGVCVVNVGYRHAPEHPWPVGVNDSYDAVKWVARNAAELQVDLKKGFIIGGTSAGGHFSCVISQRARNDPELKGLLTGQMLSIPGTLRCGLSMGEIPESLKGQLLSYEQNKDDPIVPTPVRQMFLDAYKPAPINDVRVSPLLAESFADLPPAYLQVNGGDPLRDEGLLYHRRLEQSGIPTKLDIYPGVPHAFNAFAPQLEISKKYDEDFYKGLAWLLSLSQK